MRTLRKQWAIDEIEKHSRITEDLPAFTPLLRYAQSELELPHFFTVLTGIYQSASAEISQVFLHVFAGALEALRRSSLKGVAAKAARKLIKEHMKLFYRFLSANHNAIVTPTLDMLTTMGSLDGSVNELLFGSFDFTLKPLPRFAMMRKKHLAQEERHDIRTAFVRFVFCFVEHGNYATKLGLSRMQNIIGPVIAGITEDRVELIEYILTTIRQHVLVNEKTSKALPIAFLYSSSLAKIAKLYESPEERAVIAADEFLELACTNSDLGLAFKISADSLMDQSIVKNKIILDFLLTLNPLESLRKQNLCLAILSACPDTLAAFWSRSSFSFEAESSARFINLCSFAVKVLRTVPVLVSTASDVHFLIPKGLTSASSSRGLSHSNKLAVYFSALLLAACFERANNYVRELEWHTSCESDKDRRIRLLMARNSLINELISRVPSGKIIYQAYNQLLKQNTTSATSLIAGQLLISLRLSSQLFQAFPDYGLNLVTIGPNAPVPQMAQSAFWDCIASSGTFSLTPETISFVLNQAELMRDPLLFFRLALGVVKSSGFVSSTEMAFLGTLSIDRNLCEQTLSIISQLKEDHFMDISSDPVPFIRALGLVDAFYRQNSRFFVPITAGMAQRVTAETSRIQQEEREQAKEIPEIFGHTVTAVFDEIMAKIRPDMVTRAMSKATLNQFRPVPESITPPEVSRLLLVEADASAWLQILAQSFSNERAKPKDLRLFLETGVMAIPIFALSSSDATLANAGLYVLQKWAGLLESATFRERRQIKLIFDCFLRSFEPGTRLPSATAAFMSEVIQVLLRPAHFMYPGIMEFFLANYKLDMRKIPLLMECLCSSSENMVREQTWMLRILINSLRPQADYAQTFHFNHVVPVIETLLQLPFLDAEVERFCKQILLKIVEDKTLTGDLLIQNGLMVWASTLPSGREYIADDIAAILE